jgi:hypothetical protein
VILSQPVGDPGISPNLVQICDEAREISKNKKSIFFKKPMESHQKFYRQPNGYDCGPCSVLNVNAKFVADAFYHQNWHEIRNPHDFFQLVIQPFWNVSKGGKRQGRAISKRLKLFRYNLITLLQKLAPTHV